MIEQYKYTQIIDPAATITELFSIIFENATVASLSVFKQRHFLHIYKSRYFLFVVRGPAPTDLL